jgi:hypothetical protein
MQELSIRYLGQWSRRHKPEIADPAIDAASPVMLILTAPCRLSAVCWLYEPSWPLAGWICADFAVTIRCFCATQQPDLEPAKP